MSKVLGIKTQQTQLPFLTILSILIEKKAHKNANLNVV